MSKVYVLIGTKQDTKKEKIGTEEIRWRLDNCKGKNHNDMTTKNNAKNKNNNKSNVVQ